jgi:hypothetical protein
VPGFLQTWRLAFRPKSSILVSSDQRILFLMVWESFGVFWQTPSAFYWGVASVWPLYHRGLIDEVLQRWFAFWKVLPSPQRNSRALSEWPSGLGHLPDQGPSPLIVQFGRAASSRKSLWELCSQTVFSQTVFSQTVFSDCVHRLCSQTVFSDCVLRLCSQTVFTDCVLRLCSQTVFSDCVLTDCVLRLCSQTVFSDCVLGDLQRCRHIPQICASTQSCLRALRTIPSTSWLGFCSDMHCHLWDLI